MKRFSIAVVLLLVLAACGLTAWFALHGDGQDTIRDESSNASAARPEGGDPGTDTTAPDDSDGGRKRVQAGTTPDAPSGTTIVGTVEHAGVGVAGATVEAFGAPGGGFDLRRAEARRLLGDMFSDAELERLERRFGDIGSRFGGGSGDGDSGDDSDGAGTVSISIGIGDDSGVSGSIEGSEEDIGEAMSEGMTTGMELFGRLMSNPTLLEKVMDLGKLEAAGFQRFGDWPRVASTRTEEDGSFVLTGLPPGKVEIRVHANGYVRQKRVVSTGDDPVSFQLARGAVLEGLVTSGGQPVAGATVRTKTQTVETDATGRFLVDDAVLPEESVLVSARGFVTAGRAVTLAADGPGEPVTIELEPAAIVRGVVLGSDGAPLAGASVRVTKGATGFNPMMFMQLAQQGVSAPSPSTETDANGVFELDGIPGGTVKLAAEYRGHLPFISEDIAADAGDTTEGVELRLVRESVVAGRVVGQDGTPVEGAVVKVSLDAEGMAAMIAGMMGGTWASGLTEADGTYRVGGLTSGERTVRVESPAHLFEEVVLQVPDEDSVTQDFTLRPGYTLEGMVVTPAGDPAPGARVELKWGTQTANPMAAMTGMASRADAFTTADAEGRFRFTGLQEGPYSLTAKDSAYLDADVDDVAQESTDVVLQLRSAATLRGIVLDVDGNPVSGAWVHRKGGRRSGGNPILAMMAGDPRVLTGADGTFTISKMEAGRYQLYARRQGYAESEKLKVQAAEGEEVTGLELVLRPGESLAGRVVDKGTGDPVEGAIVYVPTGSGPMAGFNPSDMISDTPSAPPNSISTTTGPDGAFLLEGLTPGRVTVEVRARDRAPASLSRIEVPGTDVTVEVGVGGVVEGYVVDASGNALTGVSVILNGGAMGMGRQSAANTDANGWYRIERIVPGSYQIMKMDGSSGFGVGGMTSVVVREGETTRHDFRPDTSGSRVSGNVKRDGKAVEGAMVMLTGGATGMEMTSTDGEGAFAFEGLQPGSYTISVQEGILGSGTKSETVKVEEGRHVTGLALQLSSLSLAGRVVDARTGEPVPGAQIILFDARAGGQATSLEEVMRRQRGQSLTDAKGGFKITGVEDGTFSVRVSAQGYAEETRDGVKPGADLTVRLEPGADFEVTVIGPDGAPVVGATVIARDSQGNETMTIGMGGLRTISNAEGVATLQLAPGRYTIVAESAGLPAGSVDVDAASGSAVLRLEQGGGLEIIVRKGGSAVTGARVALQDENGLPIVKRVSAGNILGGGAESTDSAGRVVREGLPAGRVTVTVTDPEGGSPQTRTVTVTRGRTETVEVELR